MKQYAYISNIYLCTNIAISHSILALSCLSIDSVDIFGYLSMKLYQLGSFGAG